MLAPRRLGILIHLRAAITVFPVPAGLAETVAVATLVALGPVAVIGVAGRLGGTTSLFSRCCCGGVQEGFNVEFGHGWDEKAGWWVVVGLVLLWMGEGSLQVG
jgi:hypothetical protein